MLLELIRSTEVLLMSASNEYPQHHVFYVELEKIIPKLSSLLLCNKSSRLFAFTYNINALLAVIDCMFSYRNQKNMYIL